MIIIKSKKIHNSKEDIMNKNDYAPIAPMGWNSYDYYDTTVNEEQVRANAAYLAEHLKDAGVEALLPSACIR